MKKTLLLLTAIFTFAGANAQKKSRTTNSDEVQEVTTTSTFPTSSPSFKSSKGEEFLPKAGDWAIGFNIDTHFGNRNNNDQFIDFQNKSALTNVGTMVFKKFTTDNKAYRITANLKLGRGSNSLTTKSSSTETIDSNATATGFDLTAGLGKEWRRGKTRLQGFYGADVSINLNSVTKKYVKSTDTTAGNTTTNATTETVQKGGFGFGFGLNGFLGAEYFLIPKMSLGVQYNYGLNVTVLGKSNDTTTTTATGLPTTSVSTDGPSQTGFGIGGVGLASLNLTLHF
jgi:hypothetical protein